LKQPSCFNINGLHSGSSESVLFFSGIFLLKKHPVRGANRVLLCGTTSGKYDWLFTPPMHRGRLLTVAVIRIVWNKNHREMCSVGLKYLSVKQHRNTAGFCKKSAQLFPVTIVKLLTLNTRTWFVSFYRKLQIWS